MQRIALFRFLTIVLVTALAACSGTKLDQPRSYLVYFDTDSAVIKPESEAAIKAIADLLKTDGGLKLYVVGHTDMVGKLDYNMDLSSKRAQSVVEALVGKHGVAAGRLVAKGVGPLCPVSTNATEDGRKLNRRVDLVAMETAGR